MPSRTAPSSRMFTVSYLAPTLSRMPTTVAENPQAGKRRLPFMKRTTGFARTRLANSARWVAVRGMGSFVTRPPPVLKGSRERIRRPPGPPPSAPPRIVGDEFTTGRDYTHDARIRLRQMHRRRLDPHPE